jgi:hypothetical protein
MNKEIIQILNMYPEGITTVDAAAQTMCALQMKDLAWHWDDDPRQCGFAEDEGEALNTVSDQLWAVAGEHFPLRAGDTNDAPMWEGLVDGLDAQDGIMAFRADTDPEGMVYVASSGIAAKVARSEWQTAYGTYEMALTFPDDEPYDLLGWLTGQERWEPAFMQRVEQ